MNIIIYRRPSPTPQDVPIPAGVENLDDWQHDVAAALPDSVRRAAATSTVGRTTQPSKPPQSSSPMGASTTAACTRRRTSISATTPSQAHRPASWPPR